MSTLISYSTTGDGYCQNYGASWATVRGAASSLVTNYTGAFVVVMGSYSSPNYFVIRSFFAFDTSSLDGFNIDSAQMTITPGPNAPSGSNSLCITESSQASTTSLVAADYNNITLNSPPEGATRVTQSSLTLNVAKAIPFNSTGEGFIDKTGHTKLSIRSSKDVDNSTPTSYTYTYIYSSNEAGTTRDPKLTVEYSEGEEADNAVLFGCNF